MFHRKLVESMTEHVTAGLSDENLTTLCLAIFISDSTVLKRVHLDYLNPNME